MRTLLIFSCLCITTSLSSQNLEVEGKAKITQMDKVNTADSIAVWLPDSTLGIRDATSLNRQLIDSDGDTKILVEDSPDDDIIRFYSRDSEVMRIDPLDRVGIGTTQPAARLHVDSAVLFTGNFNGLNPDPPPASGPGTRLMWYLDEAAFRTGRVTGTQWDAINIGEYSFGSGHNTVASGDRSTALGQETTASGFVSTALGNNTTALGTSSTAMGGLTIASGTASTAIGVATQANGYTCTVLGMNNDTIVDTQTSPDPATPLFIIGNGDPGLGNESNAMVVRKDGKVGIGTNTPGATITNALVEVKDGHIALSNDYGVLSNNSAGTGFGAGFDTSTDDDLFLFAGGDNRVTVDADGTFRPSADNSYSCGSSSFKWTEIHATNGTIQTSDARYKENVLPLNYGLSEIQKMRPVQYQWRNSLDRQKYVGLIAQKVQEIIPEVIRSSNEDHLGMNYAELVPVLINAVQELAEKQEEVDSLQKKNERLERELRSIKKQISQLFVVTGLDQN